MATLVIDAVPWAHIDELTDASGRSIAMPDPSTPLSIQVPVGTYKLVLTGPAGDEHRDLTVTVTSTDGPQLAPVVTFAGMRIDDYFREVMKGGR
jgi:hypothetical protein